MSTAISRRLGAVLGAAALATLVVPALPAQATPPTIETLDVVAVATSNPVTMSATASVPERVGPDGQIKEITISWAGPGETGSLTRTWGAEATRRETYTVQRHLAYNGPYTVTARAVGYEYGPPRGPDETSQASRSFAVEVEPVAPTGMKVAGDTSKRTVTISWDQNPEPDVRGYWVERAFNDGSFAEIGISDNNCDAETRRCTVADDLKKAPGGEYRYRVAAIRPDRSGEESIARKNVPSSGIASTRMPTTTATTTGGTNSSGGLGSRTGSGTGSGGTTGGGITRSGTARTGKVNLDGFAASLPQRQRIIAEGGEDPGFDSELPFESRPGPAGSGEGGDPGEVAILRERPAQSDSESHAPLLFVAAGLLATVLLMHVLWLKSEVEKVSLEPVGPAAD